MTEEFPVIKTERLLLTLPDESAAPRLLAFVAENREHFAPWSPPEPAGFYTEEFWRERLRQSREEFRRGQSMRLVIFRKHDAQGRIVGDCNFSNIIRGPFQACFLGYRLDEREVGQGFMHEALTSAIRFAFDELLLHRIMANYLPTNERSGRVLRRLGFTVEGYARDYLLINGEWRDHILTALANQHLKLSDIL